MRTFTLQLPATLEWPERDLQLLVAARFYEAGILTLSQAADAVHLSRRVFTELIGRCGVSVINHNPPEIQDDLAHAEAYLG